MHILEDYARDGEKRFEYWKRSALQSFRSGNMDEHFLKRALEEAFKAGHYTGHCRGELYMRTEKII